MNKAGEDEEAIPESHGLAMTRKQKSMGQLFSSPGQSFEEVEEDEGDDNDNNNDNDNDNDGTSRGSSLESK